MYPHRIKSSGERSGLRGGQGIGPPLPIQASGNLSFKTSVTKQLKWGGAPSCIKITLLPVSCSKVSICGNTHCLSYSGFKSRPSFSMTLYLYPIQKTSQMPLLHCYRRSHIFSVSAFDIMPIFLVIFLFLSSVKIIVRTFRQLSATLMSELWHSCSGVNFTCHAYGTGLYK